MVEKLKKRLQVVFSESEEMLIKKLAKADHRTVSTFLRLIALDAIKEKYPDAFREAGLEDY